jgi:hypothetical protein
MAKAKIVTEAQEKSALNKAIAENLARVVLS